jgi:hypothetical protein
MKLINLKDFWEVNNLKFDSFKKGLSWTKRHLDISSLRRITADNYMVDSILITKSYKEYLINQEIVYQKRVDRAKLMTKNRKEKSKPK